jgi:predicted metal-dependent phosphotriesterase family hydrolase
MGERRRGAVQTVLGPVAPELLGPTDAHEHLFLRTPALPGEALTELEPMVAEAGAVRAAGARAVADLTPIGCGRDPRQLRLLAERTGLHVIAATGFHRDVHYPAGHWVHTEPEEVLTELLVTDLTTGMDERDWQGPRPRPSPARAGIVKLGASYHALTPSERRRLAAGARAAAATGAPVAVHCEQGTMAHELLDLLAEHGVAAPRVALAHLDRNPDPGLHAELAERGAFLLYDGAGKVKYHPDSLLIDLVAGMAEAGHAGSVLLGGDLARRSELRVGGGGPGLAHLFAVLVPRLRKALGADLVDQLVVANPSRAFAFDQAAGTAHGAPPAAGASPDPADG